MSELDTVRLKLRHWSIADLAPFAALNADPAVMEFMPARLSREASDAMAARAQAHLERDGFGLWALEVRGGPPFAGYVGLQRPSFEAHFMPCVEIGWRLAHEAWGHGYATEAAGACLRHAFGVMALPEVVAFTVPVNLRSRAVMQRLGMTEDPAGAFEHPRLPTGHALRSHVLYRLSRAAWRAQWPSGKSAP
jgi:RimJ/RimL family protein N-acetyltransferase